MSTSNPTTEQDAQRLPLWRECYRDMVDNGVTYGQTFPVSYFVEWMRCEPGEIQFGIGMSAIRRALEHDGFYLSGVGQKGEQFVILAAESNQKVMTNYAASALDALKRGVILGTATPTALLSDDARRRHEAVLERMAIKVALVSRHEHYGKIMAREAAETQKKL